MGNSIAELQKKLNDEKPAKEPKIEQDLAAYQQDLAKKYDVIVRAMVQTVTEKSKQYMQ